jgi:hypothetical protein
LRYLLSINNSDASQTYFEMFVLVLPQRVYQTGSECVIDIGKLRRQKINGSTYE